MNTEKYILEHKNRVNNWLLSFAFELLKRGGGHDNSKLQEPEISGWKQMDQEPRYNYGTKEYFDKLNKYHWLMEEHWSKNRHHPEYWEINKDDKSRDLIDILEMLADWSSYKDKVSYSEASRMIEKQSERYNLSDEMRDLLLNTLTNYFVSFGNLDNKEEKEYHVDIFV